MGFKITSTREEKVYPDSLYLKDIEIGKIYKMMTSHSLLIIITNIMEDLFYYTFHPANESELKLNINVICKAYLIDYGLIPYEDGTWAYRNAILPLNPQEA